MRLAISVADGLFLRANQHFSEALGGERHALPLRQSRELRLGRRTGHGRVPPIVSKVKKNK